MHDAVSKYYQRKASGDPMEMGDLLQAFERSFDPQGFLDKAHQEERFKVGRDALAGFFKREEKEKSVPALIEEPFSFMFENNKITGRFDRVDKTPEGAVVMDFKTSQVKSQKDADKRVKDNLQLKLYSLAYLECFKELPKQVGLYFLESGLIGYADVDEGDLDKIKEGIRTVAAGLRQQDFVATPNFQDCKYCAYNQICPQAMAK
jgi:DNA helicase-2/ATP-dependent DNA helicase PcrA